MNIQREMQTSSLWSESFYDHMVHLVWRKVQERKFVCLQKGYQSVSTLMTTNGQTTNEEMLVKKTDWILDYVLCSQTLGSTLKTNLWETVHISDIHLIISSPQIHLQAQPKVSKGTIHSLETEDPTRNRQDNEETAKKLLTSSQNTEQIDGKTKIVCL